MQSDKKLRLAVGAGLLLCLTAVLLSLCLGSITISPADIVDILAGGGEGVSAGILRFSRLPRTCACSEKPNEVTGTVQLPSMWEKCSSSRLPAA